MFDLEIEALLLRLPGMSRERGYAIAQQVGSGLHERLSKLESPPMGRIQRLRIQLESGASDDEAVIVERIVEAIVKELRLR